MKLFREVPPWTIILEVLSMLHVPTEFPCTFEKTDLQEDTFTVCACLLEPYYLPCKAKQFLEYTEPTRWITILRHVLNPHGYIITYVETTRKKKKTIFYTIERDSGVLKTPVTVDFS